MRDLEVIADRVEIEALRGEFTDAAMMRDYGRLACAVHGRRRAADARTPASSWPGGRRSAPGVSGYPRSVDLFVQTTHPGTIRLDGDTASGRAYMSELIRLRDGSSHLNYAIYHDRYRRTPDGWRFTERVYEIRYLDTTALAGSAPRPAADAR